MLDLDFGINCLGCNWQHSLTDLFCCKIHVYSAFVTSSVYVSDAINRTSVGLKIIGHLKMPIVKSFQIFLQCATLVIGLSAFPPNSVVSVDVEQVFNFPSKRPHNMLSRWTVLLLNSTTSYLLYFLCSPTALYVT